MLRLRMEGCRGAYWAEFLISKNHFLYGYKYLYVLNIGCPQASRMAPDTEPSPRPPLE